MIEKNFHYENGEMISRLALVTIIITVSRWMALKIDKLILKNIYDRFF